MRRTHGALQVQFLNLLPVLGKKRHKEVDGKDDVLRGFVDGKRDVGDGDTHAGGLLRLKLEFDGSLQFVDFFGNIFLVTKNARELSGFVQTGT